MQAFFRLNLKNCFAAGLRRGRWPPSCSNSGSADARPWGCGWHDRRLSPADPWAALPSPCRRPENPRPERPCPYTDLSVGGGVKEAGVRIQGLQLVQAVEIADVQGVPIVEAGPFQMLVVHGEAQGADEMEAGAGHRAGPGHVPRVLRDLRFHHDDVKHAVAVLSKDTST